MENKKKIQKIWHFDQLIKYSVPHYNENRIFTTYDIGPDLAEYVSTYAALLKFSKCTRAMLIQKKKQNFSAERLPLLSYAAVNFVLLRDTEFRYNNPLEQSCLIEKGMVIWISKNWGCSLWNFCKSIRFNIFLLWTHFYNTLKLIEF